MSDEPIKQMPLAPTSTGVMRAETSGQFKQGWAGGPGRPKGVPNRIKADLAQTILNAAERLGFLIKDENGVLTTGEGGCEGFLVWLGLHEPTTMAMLLARILPYYVKSEVVAPVLTREETLAQLRERGLPIELLAHLRKVPARLDDDETDDPYGINVTSQPVISHEK